MGCELNGLRVSTIQVDSLTLSRFLRGCAAQKIVALRGIEWVELAFPDVNIARARLRATFTRKYVIQQSFGTHSIPR